MIRKRRIRLYFIRRNKTTAPTAAAAAAPVYASQRIVMNISYTSPAAQVSSNAAKVQSAPKPQIH